jgi:hypothetical protein
LHNSSKLVIGWIRAGVLGAQPVMHSGKKWMLFHSNKSVDTVLLWTQVKSLLAENQLGYARKSFR